MATVMVIASITGDDMSTNSAKEKGIRSVSFASKNLIGPPI